MSKQVTTTSQAKLFIGLDIHKKTWKFHFTTDIVIGVLIVWLVLYWTAGEARYILLYVDFQVNTSRFGFNC